LRKAITAIVLLLTAGIANALAANSSSRPEKYQQRLLATGEETEGEANPPSPLNKNSNGSDAVWARKQEKAPVSAADDQSKAGEHSEDNTLYLYQERGGPNADTRDKGTITWTLESQPAASGNGSAGKRDCSSGKPPVHCSVSTQYRCFLPRQTPD